MVVPPSDPSLSGSSCASLWFDWLSNMSILGASVSGVSLSGMSSGISISYDSLSDASLSDTSLSDASILLVKDRETSLRA